MNRLTLSVFSFLVFSFYSFSQKTNFPFFNSIKGERKVFADTAILRVAPSAGAAITDTIFIGENINILMQVPYSEVRNNIASPWLKITYKKGNYTKVGFISAIDVAINEKLAVKDIDVVLGLEKSIRSDSFIDKELTVQNNYYGKIKTIKATKKIAEELFKIPYQIKADSIVCTSLKKIKLKGTIGLVQMNIASKLDSTLTYQYNFVLCNKTQISQLEVINSVQKVNAKMTPIKSYFVFEPSKILYRISGFIEGDKTIDVYKWKDCSFNKE